jgi:hypothetical protein
MASLQLMIFHNGKEYKNRGVRLENKCKLDGAPINIWFGKKKEWQKISFFKKINFTPNKKAQTRIFCR